MEISPTNNCGAPNHTVSSYGERVAVIGYDWVYKTYTLVLVDRELHTELSDTLGCFGIEVGKPTLCPLTGVYVSILCYHTECF